MYYDMKINALTKYVGCVQGVVLLLLLTPFASFADVRYKEKAIFKRKDLFQEKPRSVIYNKALYTAEEIDAGLASNSKTVTTTRSITGIRWSKLKVELALEEEEAMRSYNAKGKFVIDGVLHSVNASNVAKNEPIKLSINFDPGRESYRDLSYFLEENIIFANFELTKLTFEKEGVQRETNISDRLTDASWKTTLATDTGIAGSILPFELFLSLETFQNVNPDFNEITDGDFHIYHDKITNDLVMLADAGKWSDWAGGIELEWTFAANYRGDQNYEKCISTENLYVNFRENATNVLLDKFSYRIPLIFERGIIAFRFRPLIFQDEKRDTILFGPWFPKAGSAASNWSNVNVSSYPTNFLFTVSDGENCGANSSIGNLVHEKDRLNWEHSITYSGYGIRNDVMTYLDGMMKSRQTVARNPDEYTILVQETIYDQIGQPSVFVMPVPVSSSFYNRPQLPGNLSGRASRGIGNYFPFDEQISTLTGSGQITNVLPPQPTAPSTSRRRRGKNADPISSAANQPANVPNQTVTKNARPGLPPIATPQALQPNYNFDVGLLPSPAPAMPDVYIRTPQFASDFRYYRQFNCSKSSGISRPYSWRDFDKYSADFTNLPAKPMDNDRGAALYYSPNNQFLEGAEASLPDAGGYPFSHIEYGLDGTGNPSRAGSPGIEKQINSGHEYAFYETSATQKELDRFLGNEAGYAKYYKKKIIIDPNGQASVYISNQAGKPILTGLAGKSPQSLSPLEEAAIIPWDTLNVIAPENDIISEEDGWLEKTASSSFFIAAPSDLAIHYSLTPETFRFDTCGTGRGSICLDCIYELSIEVKNMRTGAIVYTRPAQTIPYPLTAASSSDFQCSTSADAFEIDERISSLPVGNYVAIRKLKLKKQILGNQLDRALAKPCSTAVEELRPLVDETNCFSLCTENCEALRARYERMRNSDGTYTGRDETGAVIYTITQEQVDNIIQGCIRSCQSNENNIIPEISTIQNLMLLDLAPGGQYAQHKLRPELSEGSETTEDITIENNPEKFPLSVLNYAGSNKLGNQFNYKFPLKSAFNAQANYLSADGTKAYVTISNPDKIEYYQTTYSSLPTELLRIEDGRLIIQPQLLDRQDFIEAFQPSWARALLPYHPEYIYLYWYQRFPEAARGLNFDQKLSKTTSYDQAVREGFIGSGLLDKDSLFRNPIKPEIRAIKEALNTALFGPRLERIASGTGASSLKNLEQFAMITQYCHDPGVPLSEECLARRMGSDAATKDEEWSMYKQLYLQFKRKKIECFIQSYVQQSDFKDPLLRADFPYFRNQFIIGTPSPSNIYNKKQRYFTETANRLQSSDCISMVEDICATDVNIWFQIMADCLKQYAEKARYAACQSCPISNDLQMLLNGLAYTNSLTSERLGLFGGNGIPYNARLMEAMEIPPGTSGIKWMPTIPNAISLSGQIGTSSSAVFSKIEMSAEDGSTPVNWANIRAFVCLNYKPDQSSESKKGFRVKAIFANGSQQWLQGTSDKINFQNCAAYGNTCSPEPWAMALVPLVKKMFERGIYDRSGVSLYSEFSTEPAYQMALWPLFEYGRGEPEIGLPPMDIKWSDFTSLSSGSGFKGKLTITKGSATMPRSQSLNLELRTGSTIPGTGSLSLQAYEYIKDGCGIKAIKLVFTTASRTTFEVVLSVFRETTPVKIGSCCIEGEAVACGGEQKSNDCVSPCCPDLPPVGNATANRPDPCASAEEARFRLHEERIRTWMAQRHEERKEELVEKCMANPREKFTVSFQNAIYQTTLYYYDGAGNLYATVPPEGVQKLSEAQIIQVQTARNSPGYASNNPVFPLKDNLHQMANRYFYNTENLLVMQISPDSDTIKYFYDEVGRLIASQDQEEISQSRASGTTGFMLFDYVLYDNKNRVAEAGIAFFSKSKKFPRNISNLRQNMPYAMFETEVRKNSPSTQRRAEIISIKYDKVFSDDINASIPGGQRFLLNRKSAITYDQNGDGKFEHGKFYTYSQQGKTSYYLQQNKYPGIPAEHQKKLIYYEYDLLSPNAAKVHYQPGKPDQFHHRYALNSKGEIINTYTSTDDIYWQKDIEQEFRRDGSVARIETGRGIQGTDFAFTLDGKLKAINAVSNDPLLDLGNDGKPGSSRAIFPRDVIGLIMHYYSNDYKPVGALPAFEGSFAAGTPLGRQMKDHSLFNGNMAAISTAIMNQPVMTKNYHYDALQRLLENNCYYENGSIPADAGAFSFGGSPAAVWGSSYSFDRNGNFKSINRNDGKNIVIDKLSFTYETGRNRLIQVRDAAGPNTYPHDQEGTINLQYDRNGCVTSINDGEVRYKWNSGYRPDTVIAACGQIALGYDAAMNQVASCENTGITRYTVRDDNGRIMADYTIEGGAVTLNSTPIYSSVRMGIYRHNKLLKTSLPSGYGYTESGKKFYELKDHTGGILALITDKKKWNGDAFAADVVLLRDYMPYGLAMEMQNPLAEPESYQFGFQGMEQEAGCEDEHNDRRYVTYYRVYDPSVARWLSPDPKSLASNSPYFSFQGNPVIYTDEKGDWINFVIGGAVGGGAVLFGEMLTHKNGWQGALGDWDTWKKVGVGFGVGFATSGLSAVVAGGVAAGAVGTGAAIAANVGISAVGGGVQEVLNAMVTDDEINFRRVAEGAFVGGIAAKFSVCNSLLSSVERTTFKEGFNSARLLSEDAMKNAAEVVIGAVSNLEQVAGGMFFEGLRQTESHANNNERPSQSARAIPQPPPPAQEAPPTPATPRPPAATERTEQTLPAQATNPAPRARATRRHRRAPNPARSVLAAQPPSPPPLTASSPECRRTYYTPLMESNNEGITSYYYGTNAECPREFFRASGSRVEVP